MGLWGLDAPEDVGGADLPTVAMIGVNIEMGKTCVPYHLPPDSPNLRMLMATVNEDQRAASSRRNKVRADYRLADPGRRDEHAVVVRK
jgi:alkylation response protein AidB-like acyl-CoA dehydrogenase